MKDIIRYANMETLFEDAQELVRLIIMAKDFTDEELEHYFREMHGLGLKEDDEYWTLFNVIKLEAKRRIGPKAVGKLAA